MNIQECTHCNVTSSVKTIDFMLIDLNIKLYRKYYIKLWSKKMRWMSDKPNVKYMFTTITIIPDTKYALNIVDILHKVSKNQT